MAAHNDVPLSPSGGKRPLNQHTEVLRPIGSLCFGVDVGGTLSKVAIFEPNAAPDQQAEQHARLTRVLAEPTSYGETGMKEDHLEVNTDLLKGRIRFVKFATHGMNNFLNTVKTNSLATSGSQVGATGGGAYKFNDLVKEQLGFELNKYDELDCLIRGLNVLVHMVNDECYYLEPEPTDDADMTKKVMYGPMHEVAHPLFDIEPHYPFIVANIGTGVSILRVDGPASFTRIGGTSLGGGTFYGLVALLTGAKSFEEALTLAAAGDSRNVDMLVGDIYGRDYTSVGLTADTVASSFGKMVNPDFRKDVKPEDLAMATLVTITNNIGSIVYLCAKQEKVTNVIFSGNFLSKNPTAQRGLTFALGYWSQRKIRATFLRHEGYFGAVGAMCCTPTASGK